MIKVLTGEHPTTRSTETVFRSSLQSIVCDTVGEPMAADPQRPLYHPVAPPRREDHRLVTGAGRFVADLAPPGTLHLAFARSSEAHALILGIDTTEAPAEESPWWPPPPISTSPTSPVARWRWIPPASPDRISPVRGAVCGEPIAVVAAEGAAQAIDAAELIWVEYDPLPWSPMRQPPSTTRPSSTAAGATWWSGGSLDHPMEPTGRGGGRVDRPQPALAPVAVEPLAILVEPGGDRTLTVWCGHQRPHELRRLARLLGIDPATIRVIVPDVGGAFGMKGMLFPEHRCRRHGHQAATTGHLGGAPPRALLRGDPRPWLHPHGPAQWRRGWPDPPGGPGELADVGAYPHNGASIPAFSRYVATGLYDFSEVHISTTTVVTNRAPTGSYRGAGRPEAAYAIERAIDAYAAAAGLDPVEVRLANFIRDLPFTTSTGAIYDSGDYAAALRKAVEMVGLDEVRQHQEERRRSGGQRCGDRRLRRAGRRRWTPASTAGWRWTPPGR